LSEKAGSVAPPLNQRPPRGAVGAACRSTGEGAGSNSNTGIDPICIDSKACIERKKVFDTIAFKDS
jgi:hypothetical protein